MKLVELAIRNARLTISVLVFLMLAGAMAYQSIPKEAEPDIQIPIMYVNMVYNGISPEDSERLLLRPMETQVKTIAGLKKMTSTAYEGGGSVLIEFQAGTDLRKALEAVDKIRDPSVAVFRDFLLASPEMFMALGEGAGTLSHVATFWRYRFPQGKPLMAPMGEILELLQDFESGLGAEPHPLSYAA